MCKYFFLLLIVLFFSGCEKPEDELMESQIESAAEKKSFSKEKKKKSNSLIQNAAFEKSIDFNSPETAWYTAGYYLHLGVFEWAKKIGQNNTGGISLEAGSGVANDIAVIQTVLLDPDKFYRLSAWVKTEEVAGGKGANIGLYNTWISSDGITGTQEWQKISVDFVPPASGEVTIACRLGHWAAVSTGKAYFDNLILEEVEKYVETGQRIRLVIDQEDAAAVRPETISAWIANLDRAYEKYYALMGEYPYNEELITIQSVEAYPGGWAIAGNPILWHRPYVIPELQNIEATGSWSFGIMHELGHDFALENANRSWIWSEEMFANFRMYYVVEELNAPIFQGRLYTGSQIKEFYKSHAPENYDAGIALGIARGHDGLMYTLIRIKDLIGWEPFKQTYRDLNTSSVAPATHWERFNLFLDKLNHYSGHDVRATYLPGELETIEQLLAQ